MHRTLILCNYFVLNQFGGAKRKWETLEHNGVFFPEPYRKHNIPIIYQGQEIILDEIAEEDATLYAKFIETDYVKNRTFNKNFWNDWKKVLGKDHTIQSLEDVDFSLIYNYILQQKKEKNCIQKKN